MPFAWKPAAGQLTLIEVAGEAECLTGVVVADAGLGETDDGTTSLSGEAAGGGGDSHVVIDLGASPHPPTTEVEVTASFFAPDALYRIRAVATPHAGATRAIIDLRVHDVERVQRRKSHRVQRTFPVVLSDVDGTAEILSVRGETVDLGDGGCRVRTERAFSPTADPTVTLHLPDGDLVVVAAILQAQAVGAGYEYRLVFLDIDDDGRDRITALMDELVVA